MLATGVAAGFGIEARARSALGWPRAKSLAVNDLGRVSVFITSQQLTSHATFPPTTDCSLSQAPACISAATFDPSSNAHAKPRGPDALISENITRCNTTRTPLVAVCSMMAHALNAGFGLEQSCHSLRRRAHQRTCAQRMAKGSNLGLFQTQRVTERGVVA